MMQSKADLHVHTKFSDRPSEWFLRRVGAPESFTEPLDVYRRCKAKGMDFVTISDHNRIEGALEIAHLPGTFISCEVTTYFPEDGCKMHVLVTGITESQFKVIDILRENIYDFHDYCIKERIVTSVAHPLYSVNQLLDADHFERLILLFNRFEGINGARHPRACDLSNAILSSLTKEDMERLADKHHIEPVGEEPWRKVFTAGSDDHGGVYIASAFTVTPKVATVSDYLNHLRRGEHDMAGRAGTSLQLAHSFFHIAYGYYKSRLLQGSGGKGGIIASLLDRLLRPMGASHQAIGGLRGKVRSTIGDWALNRKRQKMSEPERLIFDEFRKLMDAGHGFTADPDAEAFSDRETFGIASRLSHQIGYALTNKVIERLQQGDLFESLQTIASLGPVALGVTPYLTAMKTQHKDEGMLQKMARHFGQADRFEHRSGKRAWITDTFCDINGVTTTIRSIARVAKSQGLPLTVVTCVDQPLKDDGIDLKNFQPVGEFTMPEYASQKLAFPPFLEMIDYLEKEEISELIISTPGPVGLTALMAGKLLGLRMTGIYHTDFPKYVRQLAEDPAMEAVTWRYMYWFYEQMHTILAPSEAYRDILTDYGFTSSKIEVFGRGVDTAVFHTDHQVPGFWQNRGLSEAFTFLYVGRVSAEKNVELLLASFDRLLAKGVPAQLAIVGDGPLLSMLRERHRDRRILFTGFLEGPQLAAAYASSDAFVFPSTTDTFGNVVLEAMASGLPVIVSNQGGPKETVGHSGAGMVINMEMPGAVVEAMSKLVSDCELHASMRQAAIERAAASSWEAVFDRLWNGSLAAPAASKTWQDRPGVKLNAVAV